MTEAPSPRAVTVTRWDVRYWRMPKRSRTMKPKADPNRAAFDVLQKVIDEGVADGKNPIAVALGRLGGLKGGHARAEKLTEAERTASARKAAQARWGKRKKA